jgi:hypothetical protein
MKNYFEKNVKGTDDELGDNLNELDSAQGSVVDLNLGHNHFNINHAKIHDQYVTRFRILYPLRNLTHSRSFGTYPRTYLHKF